MLSSRYLIGFTGHRSGIDETVIRPALKRALEDLQMRAKSIGGRAELYASAAEGADTLCAEVAREQGMPVHLLLPLSEEEFAKDFSSPDAWARAKAQIDLARRVPGDGSVHIVPGEATRPDCYFNKAVHMLDAVDVLIAVWDGQPANGIGGTEHVLRHAKATGVPVIQIALKTGAIEIHGDVDKALSPDAVITELNKIAEKSGVPCAKGDPTPDEIQKCLDKIAIDEASRFRPSLVKIIFLHGVAAFLAALITFKMPADRPWENSKWIVSLVEFVLVCLALWMTFAVRRRHIRERWIRCRIACELVRGLRCSVPLMDPLHPSIAKHEPEWTRFCLSMGLLVQEHAATRDPLKLRDQYLSVRLGSTSPDGQILHYVHKHPEALKWWNRTSWMNDWCARLAPAFVLLALVNKISKHWIPPEGFMFERSFWPWIAVGFLPIALPLLAGVASGLRHVLDAGRRKERYPQMTARLGEIRTSLAGLHTPSTIQRKIDHSEELLLGELLEWQLAMKSAGR